MSARCWEWRRYKPKPWSSRPLRYADNDMSTDEYLAAVNHVIERLRWSHPWPSVARKPRQSRRR